jgi:dTDP-4-dehydrorhamnose reductase
MVIVLFGSTGMLGRYVLRVLREKYEVICILRNDYDIENDNWSKLELQLNQILQKNDIIINCAGIIPQKYKNDKFKTFIKINTLFPRKINDISIKNGYKFIHITTDCVFDGIKGNYYSTDIHSATDIYGISKSLGEPEEATIIRTSIIGEELTGKKSLIEWVKSNKNGNIKGYINHMWNGVTCLELAKIILNIIDNNIYWTGVRHIFSPNVVSKYDLCCYINKIYKLNIDIEKYEDSISKNMTLNDYNIMIENNILNQIKEQYNFNLE